jgi:hypothetical protein
MSDQRKRLFHMWAEGYHELRELTETVTSSGLETPLLELVKMRTSPFNGSYQPAAPSGTRAST